MAKKIRGNHDGENGQNENYTIQGRGEVSRKTLVREVENGKHSDHSIYERNGEKYVRANPDDSSENNINKK